MKLNFSSIIIACCLSAMILNSCVSNEQKSDGAFEQVKKERMLHNDSNIVKNAIIQEPEKKEIVKKNETLDDRVRFKIELEIKIHVNEDKIKEIKGLSNLKASMNRKVKSLEQENNDLRKKIDEYFEDEKSKWESFKVSMNHNANQINIELNSIKITNKK